MEWAARSMPVLERIKLRFAKEKPLKGLRISACLHVTSETGNLMQALKLGGAEVRLSASNPLSTQDEVAAALVKFDRIPVFAIKGEDNKTYYRHLNQSLGHAPQVTMDDGADLVSTIHSSRRIFCPASSEGPKKPRRASSVFGAWPRKRSWTIPSLPLTTPIRSTSSTTDTERAKARWTAFCGRRISFWPD